MTFPTPQGIGVFGLPAGVLLIDSSSPSSQQVRQDLAAGKLPQRWPEELAAHELAYRGDVDAAADIFAASDTPAAKYNLFVLRPEAISRAEVTQAVGEQWKPLVDYVSFMVGLTSVPPSAETIIPEVRALAETGQAAAWLDDGKIEKAVDHMRLAVEALPEEYRALRGIILSELAVYQADTDLAEEAVQLLKDTDLTQAKSQAQYHLAGLLHGLAIEGKIPFERVIGGYTDALRGLNETDHRGLFARIHLNMGTALLAAPLASASDSMRAAVAIQSLRSAERLLEEEPQSQEYQNAKLNLANALVYAPSSTRRDNLVEAVDKYQQLVEMRASDPAGKARVLANQGTALGHLGFIGDAQKCLTEAQGIFVQTGEQDAAEMVREQLETLKQSKIWAEGTK